MGKQISIKNKIDVVNKKPEAYICLYKKELDYTKNSGTLELLVWSNEETRKALGSRYLGIIVIRFDSETTFVETTDEKTQEVAEHELSTLSFDEYKDKTKKETWESIKDYKFKFNGEILDFSKGVDII